MAIKDLSGQTLNLQLFLRTFITHGLTVPFKPNIENLSEIHHQLIAHVFNTHFDSLRALIIYEVIGLRRLSTNCGFGLISMKREEDFV